jgi:membrane-associated phospholipid phosphatase
MALQLNGAFSHSVDEACAKPGPRRPAGRTRRSTDSAAKASWIVLATLGSLGLSHAQTAPALSFYPLGDGIAAAVAVGAAIGSQFLPPVPRQAWPPLDSLPAMDRASVRPFDQRLDALSDVSLILTVAFLAVPVLAPGKSVEASGPWASSGPYPDWLETAVVSAEALGFAEVSKNGLKWAFRRPRPYLYDPASAMRFEGDADAYRSFPSGHATTAFAAAAAATVLYAERNPGSPWAWALGASAFASASATAWLRVESGNHYFSDVLAGALLGTLVGVAIPLAHAYR